MKSLLPAAMALCLTIPAWSEDLPATANPASYTAPTMTQEEIVSQFRSDLMASRADIMAKGLTLTADQAAKFWPLFQDFQKEETAIVDTQLKALQDYGKNYKTLSDADALAWVNSLLERDRKMNELRVKWLAKFQKVLPPKVAASAIQLDRRLGNITQVQISSQIPLVN
jgi:Spy/CpxP family protein refolding chaperone